MTQRNHLSLCLSFIRNFLSPALYSLSLHSLSCFRAKALRFLRSRAIDLTETAECVAVVTYMLGGNGPHNGIRNSSFALATLREDGFAGLRGSGDATTTLLNATGSKLTITADILSLGGSVTVAIAEAGTPHTVSPVTANVTKHAALSGLKIGSRVAVKMTLKDAMVYTLGFTD